MSDWVPNGIDLQTRNRNDLSGGDCEQLAKYFYRFLGWPVRASTSASPARKYGPVSASF